ncbi:uncharacterized protein [Rutidosis leptorrhynchoides]|uniref:uncharacterized protein n=1 Tax=Rutidosis leptorrhynchoides TaxID=125765 RepID=UPI003A9908A2
MDDFWIPKPSRKLGDGQSSPLNSSITEPKRSHQWFINGAETVLHPNKKQAVAVHPDSFTALLNSNIYYQNSTSFYSVIGDETPLTSEFDDVDSLSMGRKVVTDPFEIDSTFEPQLGISYGGIRKVKVNEVKDTEDFITGTLGSVYSTGDGYIKADTFNRGENSNIPMCEAYRNNNESIETNAQSFIKEDASNIVMDQSFNVHNNNALSMVSFGGLNDRPENFDYDFVMGHSSFQRLEGTGLSEYNRDFYVNSVQIPTPAETISKKRDPKVTKKTQQNNFPTNVRSLLSTGMLDGVSVKYVAWSQEKELRGVIKGAFYLCGCQSCTFSKAINAFEFERHAGCKTKHPNNHIYFDNGKTIYGVVQELRNTPQNVLFDVIQTITGSPINQKSFLMWKDSFLAATRELHRIYGKEERTIVS